MEGGGRNGHNDKHKNEVTMPMGEETNGKKARQKGNKEKSRVGKKQTPANDRQRKTGGELQVKTTGGHTKGPWRKFLQGKQRNRKSLKKVVKDNRDGQRKKKKRGKKWTNGGGKGGNNTKWTLWDKGIRNKQLSPFKDMKGEKNMSEDRKWNRPELKKKGQLTISFWKKGGLNGAKKKCDVRGIDKCYIHEKGLGGGSFHKSYYSKKNFGNHAQRKWKQKTQTTAAQKLVKGIIHKEKMTITVVGGEKKKPKYWLEDIWHPAGKGKSGCHTIGGGRHIKRKQGQTMGGPSKAREQKGNRPVSRKKRFRTLPCGRNQWETFKGKMGTWQIKGIMVKTRVLGRDGKGEGTAPKKYNTLFQKKRGKQKRRRGPVAQKMVGNSNSL